MFLTILWWISEFSIDTISFSCAKILASFHLSLLWLVGETDWNFELLKSILKTTVKGSTDFFRVADLSVKSWLLNTGPQSTHETGRNAASAQPSKYSLMSFQGKPPQNSKRIISFIARFRNLNTGVLKEADNEKRVSLLAAVRCFRAICLVRLTDVLEQVHTTTHLISHLSHFILSPKTMSHFVPGFTSVYII